MIVICEECGKKHKVKVDVSKMSGKMATAKCSSCNHKMLFSISDQPHQANNNGNIEIGPKASPKPGNKYAATPNPATDTQTRNKSKVKRRLGIRSKMLLLFFIIPVVLFGLSSVLYLGQLKSVSTLLSQESFDVVTDISELVIEEKAYAVARQVGLYLKTHPSLAVENFKYDNEFMNLAVQKVGKTGYTVVNSGPTDKEPWRVRAHPRKELIGADIMTAVKKKTSPEDFVRFKRMHDVAIETQKLSTGYYRFLDGLEKFQAMSPIEGTNYWLIATTYLGDFTKPMRDLQEHAGLLTNTAFRIVIIILASTILLVAVVAIMYGTALSKKIKALTDVTNRISLGDLNAEIDINSKDELGDLADAIVRMQSSVRISMALTADGGAAPN